MKKYFNLFIFLIFFLSVNTVFAQKEKAFRVLSSGGVPVTGLSSNIKFLKSPYNYPADTISGITVTESGTQGNYRAVGFTTFREVKMYISAVDQTSWYSIQLAGDPATTFLLLAGGTMTGNLDMNNAGFIISPKDPTGDTHVGDRLYNDTRYAQNAATEAITGVWTYNAGAIFDNVYPYMSYESGYVAPTNSAELVPKQYVDELFGGAVGVVQSTYMIKCIPTRTTEDRFSMPTMEKCYSYLSGLTSIANFRGVIAIEPTAVTGCSITIDNGTSQWCSNGIDIFSYNKVMLTRQAANTSLTSTTRLTNIYIYDVIATSRAYTNFTFENCDIFFNGSGNSLSFTSCKFLGTNRIHMVSGDVNLTNCSGTSVWTDGTATITGTQPIDVRVSLNSSDLGF